MKGVDISVYNIVKQCVSLLYLRELRAERFQSQLLYLFFSMRSNMMSCLLLSGYPVHVTSTIHVQTNNYLVSTLLWAEPSITTFSKGWTTPTKAGSFRLSAGPGRMQYYLAIGLAIGASGLKSALSSLNALNAYFDLLGKVQWVWVTAGWVLCRWNFLWSVYKRFSGLKRPPATKPHVERSQWCHKRRRRRMMTF